MRLKRLGPKDKGAKVLSLLVYCTISCFGLYRLSFWLGIGLGLELRPSHTAQQNKNIKCTVVRGVRHCQELNISYISGKISP